MQHIGSAGLPQHNSPGFGSSFRSSDGSVPRPRGAQPNRGSDTSDLTFSRSMIDDLSIVTVNGRLIESGIGKLRTELLDVNSGSRRLVLDLRQVEELDEVAIEALVECDGELRQQACDLIIIRPSLRAVGWRILIANASTGRPRLVDELFEALVAAKGDQHG